MSTLPSQATYVIIGAGIHGLSTGMHLAQRLRAQGTIGDEAYHRLEEEIAWAELDASPPGRFQPLMT